MAALTRINSMFVKAGILKFNGLFYFQVCKLMLNTLWGLKICHSCFNPFNAPNTRLEN